MFTLIYLGKFSILTNIFKQMGSKYQLPTREWEEFGWLPFKPQYLLTVTKEPVVHWTSGPFRSDKRTTLRKCIIQKPSRWFQQLPRGRPGKECTSCHVFLDWNWVDVQILMKRYVIVIFNLKTMKPLILLTYLSALSLWLSLLFFLPSSWIHIICTYHVCGREIQHLHLIEGPSCGQTWQVTWYSRNNQPPSDVFLWFWLWVHPPSPITVDKECIQCYGGGPILTFTFHS